MKLHEFLKRYPFTSVEFSCDCKNFGEPTYEVRLYNKTYYFEPIYRFIVKESVLDDMFVDFETAMLTAAADWLTKKQEPKYPQDRKGGAE